MTRTSQLTRDARDGGIPRAMAMLLVSAMLLTACGSQLTHDEIVAANREARFPEDGAPGSGAPVGAGSDGSGKTTGEAGVSIDTEGPANDGSGKTTGEAGVSIDTEGPANDRANEAGGAGRGEAGKAPEGTAARPEEENAATTGTDKAPSGDGEKPPITIAQIGTNSGITGSILGTAKQAAMVFGAWINDNGGLNGHPVQVLTANDEGDPSRAQEIVADFIENKGVVAFFGTMVPFTSNAVRKEAGKRNVPVIGGDLLTQTYFDNEVFYPQGSSFSVLGKGTVKRAVDQGHSKIGLLYCVEAPDVCNGARKDISEASEKYGAEFVYDAAVSLGQPSFTSECLQARNAGADVVVVYLDANSIVRVADDCANQGYEPQLYGASIGVTEDLLRSPNTNGTEVMSSVFPWVQSKSAAEQEFHAAFEQYLGAPPRSGPQAQTWTSGKLLQAASQYFPDGEVTPKDIHDAMYQLRDEDVGGLTSALSFERGKPRPRPQCYWIVGVRAGKMDAPEGSKKFCL